MKIIKTSARPTEPRGLFDQISRETRPRVLADVLNENRIARVVVHPSFHRYTVNKTDRPKRIRAKYEHNLAELFSRKKDFERALFLFESGSAREITMGILQEKGAILPPEILTGYSFFGQVFDAHNCMCREDWADKDLNGMTDRRQYETTSDQNLLLMKVMDLLKRSQGVLILGIYLGSCVDAAFVDVQRIAQLIGLDDQLLTVNPAFCIKKSDLEDRGWDYVVTSLRQKLRNSIKAAGSLWKPEMKSEDNSQFGNEPELPACGSIDWIGR